MDGRHGGKKGREARWNEGKGSNEARRKGGKIEGRQDIKMETWQGGTKKGNQRKQDGKIKGVQGDE